jgi:hypothetical protein
MKFTVDVGKNILVPLALRWACHSTLSVSGGGTLAVDQVIRIKRRIFPKSGCVGSK